MTYEKFLVGGCVEWLYMRRVIVASGCSRSFGIFFVLIGKVCRGVRRVREEGFEDFFEISKMVDSRRRGGNS